MIFLSKRFLPTPACPKKPCPPCAVNLCRTNNADIYPFILLK